ncbi:MAG: hypothetical protein LIP28_06205, partial [Deltaproteobacteria bacterium]|nr:hypothetical protein [Deltaproteobacteria bacterium]
MSQIKYAPHPRVTFRCHLQHHLNPLHFYCRLRDWGVSRNRASQLCSRYERVYRLFFKGDTPTDVCQPPWIKAAEAACLFRIARSAKMSSRLPDPWENPV